MEVQSPRRIHRASHHQPQPLRVSKASSAKIFRIVFSLSSLVISPFHFTTIGNFYQALPAFSPAKGGQGAFGGKFGFKYTTNMLNSPLEQSIFKTLAYFDLLNYPLTKEELFRYLWMPPQVVYEEFVLSLRAERSNPPEIAMSVVSSNLLAMTEQKYGYYFLLGREDTVERRRRAIVPTELKLRKARHAAKLLCSIPFLRAIFVCNSVGAEVARPESDIDFFIVAEPNRIWLVRFFTNFILRLFGLRTYGTHERDRICLSFYVDADHLDLAPWRVADDDIHFAYWLHQMLPIYDPGNYYEKFLEANSWTKRFLPNMRIPPNKKMGRCWWAAANTPPPLFLEGNYRFSVIFGNGLGKKCGAARTAICWKSKPNIFSGRNSSYR